jgi:glycosyltransferase involved in cell wall biosynthesis
MASNKVTIIIPAFNEASSIERVINELKSNIDEKISILVVNDCSHDDTVRQAHKAGATVLDLKKNIGYSKAIESGLNYVIANLDSEYMITVDADGQHSPESVHDFIKFIQLNKVDLIAGKRKRCARFSERVYSNYFSYRFNISDPLCGLKLYSTSVYKNYGKFETFDSIGCELLTWGLLKGLNIKELEVVIRERKDEPRFGSFLSANIKILASFFKTLMFINKYKKNTDINSK